MSDAISNVLVAMINNKFLTNPNEVAEAYKTIYAATRNKVNFS